MGVIGPRGTSPRQAQQPAGNRQIQGPKIIARTQHNDTIFSPRRKSTHFVGADVAPLSGQSRLAHLRDRIYLFGVVTGERMESDVHVASAWTTWLEQYFGTNYLDKPQAEPYADPDND